jgi:hypothetical protein
VIRIMNELARVLALVGAFKEAKTTCRAFAAREGLHPSALSRILRVGTLPEALLSELASFERLSRTHLEVLAAADEEERPALLEQVRKGGSTYRLRAREERVARVRAETPPADLSPAPASPPASTAAPAPEDPRACEIARELGSSPEEAGAFALELLSVLLRDSRARVRASFAQFRARRSTPSASALVNAPKERAA